MDSSRRDFIKLMGLGAGALAFQGCVSPGKGGRPEGGRPNIVLVLADDLGLECLGCYGSRQYHTPNLDRLAREGIRFERAYANPLCTPSRVKLMTGLSNVRNYHAFSILLPGQTTFAHVLKKAGYRTAAAGKWQLFGASHYGPLAGKGTLPGEAGFDEWRLWQVDRLGSRYWNPLVVENGKYIEDTKGRFGPDLFCDFLLDFMERNRKGPFFAYYPMVLTHAPFTPTPAAPKKGKRSRQTLFEDMVSYMDRLVGRIAAKLDELGIRGNTLFLFAGDNGTPRSIRSRFRGRVIQGGKSLTTDAGIHVPFIANRPGFIPPGRVCGDLVDLSDFLPTMAEAAGVPLPPGLHPDGRSFLPQLRGRRGNPKEALFMYYHPRPRRPRFRKARFAFDKEWKLYSDGRLFHYAADPEETRSLRAGEGSREARDARRRLQALLDSMPKKGLRIWSG